MATDKENVPVKTFNLSEDGWAVSIGSLLILVALGIAFLAADFKFTVPVYQWKNSNDLFTIVFGLNNLLLLGGIGLIFGFVSSLAIWLSGGNARRFVTGFALIYVLALAALIIAGNKSINAYGIEYVVFALMLGIIDWKSYSNTMPG